MEDSKTLGARIQAHRRRMGLSQEQLAERLGVSRQAVSKWELEVSHMQGVRRLGRYAFAGV